MNTPIDYRRRDVLRELPYCTFRKSNFHFLRHTLKTGINILQ